MAVAQLVERRPVEANVAGSNPVSHPWKKRKKFKKQVNFTGVHILIKIYTTINSYC